MAAVICRRCGVSFPASKVVPPEQDAYCCLGCALRARVPVDAQGQFPVNAQLVFALVLGFLYFNQLLFWGLSELLVRDGRVELAGRMIWLSVILGLVMWTGVVVVSKREHALRGVDLAVALLVLGIHAVTFRIMPPSVACMAVGNALFLGWSVRGVFRRPKVQS